MTRCINPEGYDDGYDLRTDRALSLFRLLQSCRKRPLSRCDRILDLGCGPRSSFPKFWNLIFDKLNLHQFNRPLIVGIDLEESDSTEPMPQGFEYICEDINCWHPSGHSDCSYSIVTSIYSWHWILGGSDHTQTQKRASVLYRKIEALLGSDSYLAIQHLYTHDTMPEITTIALAALQASGIPNVASLSRQEYQARRARSWLVPNSLDQIRKPYERFCAEHPETKLRQTLVSGSRSWHWKNAYSLWLFWRTVNLPVIFCELNSRDLQKLEKAFLEILCERKLASLDIPTHRDTSGNLYVRITVNAAHEIAHKKDLHCLNSRSVTLPPDLPNRVRSRLANHIGILEDSDPWFGVKGLRLHGKTAKSEVHSRAIDDVLEPILTCVSSKIAKTYSLNLRETTIGESGTIGHMSNVFMDVDDEVSIQTDTTELAALKKAGESTLSEFIFSSRHNPDDIIAFAGNLWSNHDEWYRLNVESDNDAKPSAVTMWVGSKMPFKEEPENTENVIFADYLWEPEGWREKDRLHLFFRFLIRQLRNNSRSCLIITSNRAVEGDVDSLDSASITFFQNNCQIARDPNFPEVHDCFLAVDAMQELALLRERMNSRRVGRKRLISASSHEQQQVFDYILSDLFQQNFDTWFEISTLPDALPSNCIGKVQIQKSHESMLHKMRIIPSSDMLEAAIGFFTLWIGSRSALDDWFYKDRVSLSLGEALQDKIPRIAANVAALTQLRGTPIGNLGEFQDLQGSWELFSNKSKLRIRSIFSNLDYLSLCRPKPSEVAIRDKQLWFIRACLAALLNALKNSPPNSDISFECSVSHDRQRITVSVHNPRLQDDIAVEKLGGTRAVLMLAAEMLSQENRISPRFGPCDAHGAKVDDGSGTHWLTSMQYTIGNDWLKIR